jgi:small nuclear ribonucleoprotein (snRNP)-like protein
LSSTLLTLAHRKGIATLLGLLLLMGGGATLAACSSIGSGAGTLQGRVASIDLGNASFVVTPQQNSAGLTSVSVRVNTQTEFRGALHGLADLVVGMLVKVQGSSGSTAFTAAQVENDEQNDDRGADGQREEFKGTVDSINSSSASFGLKLADGSTRQVITNAQTAFEGTLHSFDDLATGQRVEVKGTVQADNSILASSVEGENEDEANVEDEGQVEGTGSVLAVGSASFVMQLGARQVTVIVSSSTDFDGGLHGIADLKVGMLVEMKGQLQSNGAIAATRVHGEDGHDGGDDHGGSSGHGGGENTGSGGGDDSGRSGAA